MDRDYTMRRNGLQRVRKSDYRVKQVCDYKVR